MLKFYSYEGFKNAYIYKQLSNDDIQTLYHVCQFMCFQNYKHLNYIGSVFLSVLMYIVYFIINFLFLTFPSN
jgi:hypothetical protein